MLTEHDKTVRDWMVPSIVEQSGNIGYSSGMMGNVVGKFTTEENNVRVDVPSSRDSTFDMMHTPDVSLADFLARPIRICEYTVPIGSVIDATESPSRLFMLQKRVANRISNYAFISGRLHLKIICTGTAFHYGKMVYAYEPMPAFRASKANPTTYPVLQQILQLPYASVDINATEGSILSYELLHPYGAIDLTRINDNVNVVDRTYLTGIGPLRAVGDTVNPVTISVYAWMTDVKLSLPTITNIEGLVEQSGEYSIENAAKPSTIPGVGKVVGSIVNTIKPYAKATADAIGMGLMMAQALGFSRPSVIQETRAIQNRPFGNITHCNVADTSVKLSLDSKQEVTIDPGVIGLPSRDEMSIVDIASREFLVKSVTWSTVSASRTVLQRWAVTPCLYAEIGDTGYLPAPSYLVAAPFRKWRGTMFYRIEIVASAFHKGMLRIVYDPKNNLDQTSIGEEENDNVIYSHVIDITKTRNYEFCVGMGTNLSYCRTFGFGTQVVRDGTTAIPFVEKGFSGYVAIQVLLPLTTTAVSPSVANNDVEINIYSHAGPDFEVADPGMDYIQSYTPLTSNYIENSGVVEESTGLVAPLDPHMICLNNVNEMADDGKLSLIHFGEKITSIRQLLMRYSLHSSYFATIVSGAIRSWGFRIPAFPPYRGPSLNPMFGTTQNNCRVHALNWFTPCFLGWRGSIRWKVHNMGDQEGLVVYQDSVYRAANGVGGYSLLFANMTEPVTLYNVGTFITNQSGRLERGGTLVVRPLNPVHEIEMPYHYQERFKYGGVLNTEVDKGQDSSMIDSWEKQTLYQVTSNRYLTTLFYVAAGDDFSLHFFKYTVVVYSNELPYDPI